MNDDNYYIEAAKQRANLFSDTHISMLDGKEVSDMIRHKFMNVEDYKRRVNKIQADNRTKPHSRYFRSKPALIVTITREEEDNGYTNKD